MKRSIALAAALACLAGPLSLAAVAAEGPSLEQVLVESASTPQQHAALANYYQAKAAAARKDAEYHRNMGKTYSSGKVPQIAMMKDHCNKLAKLYDDQAKEFDAMAAMHRDMAK